MLGLILSIFNKLGGNPTNCHYICNRITLKLEVYEKIAFTLLVLFVASTVFAQTQEDIDKLFKEGNYTKAVELVKQRDSIAAEKVKSQKKSAALLKDAEWYYQRKQYKDCNKMLDKARALNQYNDADIEQQVQSLSAKTSGKNGGSPLGKLSFGVTGGMDFLSTNFGWNLGLSVK